MGTLVNVDSVPAPVASASRLLRAAHGKRIALLAVVDGTPGLRAAAVRVRRLLGQPMADVDAGRDESRPNAQSTSEVLVGGAKMRFYHRAGCPMAADRDWSAATSGEHDRAGRSPCGMCTP
jgi:Ser/Thr protein kinase RdoA (MazF antagonist)